MGRRALIAAGGTGGHLYPGIALAHRLKASGCDVSFVVRRGDMGRELIDREGFVSYELTAQGLPRTLSTAWLRFPFRFIRGLIEVRGVLKAAKPDVVVGMGGFVSFPVVAAARIHRIPSVIHEQNVLPGLTNRLLGRLASRVAISFESSRRYFPNHSTTLTGLPIRGEFGAISTEEGRQRLGLERNRKTVVIFGGSLGATTLNRVVPEALEMLAADLEDAQVLHISGARDVESTRQRYRSFAMRSTVVPYCHDMPSALAAASIVIARAGASTIAELLATGRRAILIPYPFATGNHQLFNAKVLVDREQAEMILEKDLVCTSLARAIVRALKVDSPLRQKSTEEPSRPHGTAAQRLAEVAIGLLADGPRSKLL